MNRSLSFLMAALLCGACSEDLDSGGDPSDASPRADGAVGADGTRTLTIDATDEAAWSYLHLGQGLVDEGATWDLSFRRFDIQVNGGVSGEGLGLAVFVADATLEDATRAPDAGWRADEVDGDDEGEAPDRVFDLWYAYDPTTHVLTPKAGLWYVRGADGERYYALRIDGYYDDAGTSGHVSLAWRAVEPPTKAPPDTVEPGADAEPPPPAEDAGVPPPSPPADVVPLDAREGWVYAQVHGEGLRVVDEPAPWDLAFDGSFVKTHGGTSAEGHGGARLAPAGVDYESLDQAPTVGYQADQMMMVPGPPGSPEASGNPVLNTWWDYDPSTHRLSPKDVVFFLRTASGGYAKVQIWSYDQGIVGLRASTVEPAPETISLTAPEAEGWTHYSLRAGGLVEVADPSADAGWDLAVAGVRLRTNGGTSGGGAGGAYEVEGADLDAVMSVDQARCEQDAELPLPGPPGSGSESGNPALATWYDYDASTHQVSPRATNFAVCTADGGAARLRITGYADGVLTFDYAYAGAGRSTF